MQTRSEIYQAKAAELAEYRQQRAYAYIGTVGLRAGGYYSIAYSLLGIYNQNPTAGMAVTVFGAILTGGAHVAQRKIDVLGQDVRNKRGEIAQMQHVDAMAAEEAARRAARNLVQPHSPDLGPDITIPPLSEQQPSSPRVPEGAL